MAAPISVPSRTVMVTSCMLKLRPPRCRQSYSSVKRPKIRDRPRFARSGEEIAQINGVGGTGEQPLRPIELAALGLRIDEPHLRGTGRKIRVPLFAQLLYRVRGRDHFYADLGSRR